MLLHTNEVCHGDDVMFPWRCTHTSLQNETKEKGLYNHKEIVSEQKKETQHHEIISTNS